MDTQGPPLVPPKKSKKPPTANLSEDKDNSGEDVVQATNQVAGATSSPNAEHIKSIDSLVHSMMDSIAELDGLVSSSKHPVNSAGGIETNPLMTSSLPVLPSEVSTTPSASHRPTPTPRASVRKKNSEPVLLTTPTPSLAPTPSVRKNSPAPKPRIRAILQKSQSDQGLSVPPKLSLSSIPDETVVNLRSDVPQEVDVRTSSNSRDADDQQLPKDPPSYNELEAEELYLNISVSNKLHKAPPDIPVRQRIPGQTEGDNSIGSHQSNNVVASGLANHQPAVGPSTTKADNTTPSSMLPGKTVTSDVSTHNNVSRTGLLNQCATTESIPNTINFDNIVLPSDLAIPNTAAPTIPAKVSIRMANAASSVGTDTTASTTSPDEAHQQVQASDGVYGNMDSLSGSHSIQENPLHSQLKGFPLPPSAGDPLTPVTPLSTESLSLLDPTEYMSLWELKSIQSSSTEGTSDPGTPTNQIPPSASDALNSSSSTKRVGPPIPPRLGDNTSAIERTTPTKDGEASSSIPHMRGGKESAPVPYAGKDDSTEFPFPHVPSSKSSYLPAPTSSNHRSALLRGDLTSAMEFRNSFMLSLPDDPFADDPTVDIFSQDNPAFSDSDLAPPASNDTSPKYSLAEEPTNKKLIPRRPAPQVPPTKLTKQGGGAEANSTEVSTLPIGQLYTQITKQPLISSKVIESDGNPYSLAEEVPAPTWFVNPAASYDSEDTLDSDTDSDSDQPDLPPKILPVVASPRGTQKERRGYLFKQGGKQNNKGWRKRYVTFDGDRLRYFSSEKSRVSKRIIPVQVMKCVENDVKDLDSGKFKFRVETLNRVYMFAAESLEDHHFWTHILMEAVIKFNKKNSHGSVGLGMMRGGTMHTPDLEGFVRLNDNKKYLAVKDGKLCYYNSENDYQFATPIHEVSLDTASVKDVGKNRLQLTTPYTRYNLNFDSDTDLEKWKISLEDGIAAALSDDNVLNEVYVNTTNRQCADCSRTKPHWAVLHIPSVVCSHCAGIHRQFWPFKVKSLRMDVKVWTKPLIDLYVAVGNGTINSVWEANLTSNLDKITAAADSSQRQAYILKKYLRKAFFPSAIRNLPAQLPAGLLNQELVRAIKQGQLSDVMFLINQGADVTRPLLPFNQTSLQLAESSNHNDIAQYLKLNGAENESYADIWAVMREQLPTDNHEEDNNVIKSGHLFKIQSSKKETYPRHWIVLTTKTIKFYETEADSEPKFTIPCRSIINLSYLSERDEPCFEMVCNGGGNSYIYGADLKDDIYQWMNQIHKLVTATPVPLDLDMNFSKAGHVHCKRGSLGVWKWCWLQNNKKTLYIIDSKISWTKEIDLRKVLKLSLAVPDETTASGPGEEGGSLLVLYLSDHYVYIQSDLKHETEKWHKVIDHACKEVSHNLEDQQLNKDNVPVLIEKCIEFISLHGMTMEGIYRLSGTHLKVAGLLNDFINGARSVHIKIEDYTVHDVANVLKRYLRNLKEPVMSSLLYGQWLSAAMLTKSSSITTAVERAAHDQKLNRYKELLERLPAVNFATLKMIIGHLNRVAAHQEENKMGQLNLATLFGPVLLSGSSTENPSQQTFVNTSYEIQLADDLMTYYQWLFSVQEEELEKENKIQAKIEEMKKFNPHSAAPSGEFILGIYIHNNLGEPINSKIPAQKTAAEIVADVASAKRIPRVDGYSLFEIVCSGELERPLSENEKVLSATLAQSSWSAEHTKGNYLCVKEDTLRHCIEHSSGPDISRFTELQFSDKKGWKKMYFELTSSQLVCYKDRNNNKVNEWNISDLCIYIGVEKKRKPPTAFGITFLSATDDKSKFKDAQFLGRSVCFTTDDEMFTWLSSIYYTQSHDKTPPSSLASSVRVTSSGSEKSAVALFKKAASPKFRIPQSIKKPFKRSKDNNEM